MVRVEGKMSWGLGTEIGFTQESEFEKNTSINIFITIIF